MSDRDVRLYCADILDSGAAILEFVKDLTFEEFCTDVRFTRIKYNRFRADVDHENRIYKADHTDEFLVLGKIHA